MNIDQVLYLIFAASLLIIVFSNFIARLFLKSYGLNKANSEQILRKKRYSHKFPQLELKKMIWIVRLSGAMGIIGIVFMYFFVQFVGKK